ncbi:hypothetical protein AB0J74_33525 [Asanoa sp. NPDC049573]|uniref:hypothetical protein n=1 Tax=Asanoa sp. NPDC049573 TaxID=3155396 RepID=UPI003436ABA6
MNVYRLGLAWAVTWVAVVGSEVLLAGSTLVLPVAAVSVGAAFALLVRLVQHRRRGPILALNAQGIWVSTRVRGQRAVVPQFAADLLPWSSIERVYCRRIGIDKRVCVKARFPRSVGLAGSAPADILQLLYGTPYNASLTFGDRPAADVLEAITRYGGGKTTIDL